MGRLWLRSPSSLLAPDPIREKPPPTKEKLLPPNKRLLLIGAGHSHLLLLARIGRLRAAGLDPVLIAPRWFHYSGLATGVLSGDLDYDANRIDIAAYAPRQSVLFIEGRVSAVDREARTVTLEDGGSHGYDLLSFNIGSEAKQPVAGATPVKPLANLTDLRRRVEAYIAEHRSCPRIVIAGAGHSGTEIAATLAGLAERNYVTPAITLVGELAGQDKSWRRLYRSLEQRGVACRFGAKVEAECETDILVAATGLQPNPLARTLDVRHGERGGIAVTAALQSPTDSTIFATGDCADFLPRTLPQLGVFGVRQAPILAHNLAAAARGAPLRDYEPQRHWLSILDLGNGEGFATWGPFAHRSRAALILKRRLDLGFVRRFQC